MKNRPANYNQSLDFLAQEEAAGNAFVLAPQKPVELSRFERDEDKLKALYQQGYDDAKARINELRKFLG